MKTNGYNELPYSIRILNIGDGSYSVEVPKLPGCYSSGRSREECIQNIIEAISLHLEGLKNRPPPDEIPAIEVHQPPSTGNDHLVSLPEARRFLDVSDATLRRYIKEGKVPAYNFRKEYKFKISELSAFVESSRVVTRSFKIQKGFQKPKPSSSSKKPLREKIPRLSKRG